MLTLSIYESGFAALPARSGVAGGDGPDPVGGHELHWRDRKGVETAAIATVVQLDGKRVMDVGCGTGRLTSVAAARAASVYAFDPNGESAAARAAVPAELRRRVRFAAHSAEALDVGRRRFDLALCGWSL